MSTRTLSPGEHLRPGLRAAAAALALAMALALSSCDTGGTAGAQPGAGDAAVPVEPATTTTTAPAAAAELPEGPASDLPWYAKGLLHVGETTIRTERTELRYANGTTLAGHYRVDGSELFLVQQTARGARLRRLVRSKDPVEVTLSADGSTVVWRETLGERMRRVTAYDVGSRRRLGSVRVPVHTFCCTGNGDVYVTSILRDGRVVWHTADRRPPVVWRPGDRDTVPLSGHRSNALSMDGWPGGVMWSARTTDSGVYATVGRNGVVHAQGRVPTDQMGVWSPDGTNFVYTGQEDGPYQHMEAAKAMWVKNITTGELLRLGLAADDHPQLIGWESPTEVLVLVTAENPDPGERSLRQALVRCEATTGACERPTGFPSSRPVYHPMW